MRNLRQNLVGAFGYNVLGIPVAMGVLYPFIGLLLSPLIAAAAMAFSSVTVVTNAGQRGFFRASKLRCNDLSFGWRTCKGASIGYFIRLVPGTP